MNKNKKLIHKGLRKFIKNVDETTCVFNTHAKVPKKRRELFKKQREKYGFDERETWSLDYTTITWLYAHLERYLAWGGNTVELFEGSMHMFDVKVAEKIDGKYVYDVVYDEKQRKFPVDVEISFVEKKLYLGEVIQVIMDYFGEYLQNADFMSAQEILTRKLAQEGIRLYAEILPALWW